MASSLGGASVAMPKIFGGSPAKNDHRKYLPIMVNVVGVSKRRRAVGLGSRHVAFSGPAEQQLSEKVEKSIKEAQEACNDDPASGECAAKWDEVEELSAAASHARDKKKLDGSDDPLENYCKENPETDECRTYE